MHEASIVQALIDRIEVEAQGHGAGRVTTIDVRLGELAGVEAVLLASAWEVLRAGTLCAEAELRLHPVAAHWACPRCGGEILRGQVLRCLSCALPARLIAGDELILDRFELDVADLEDNAMASAPDGPGG